jgi:hypothetical protein
MPGIESGCWLVGRGDILAGGSRRDDRRAGRAVERDGWETEMPEVMVESEAGMAVDRWRWARVVRPMLLLIAAVGDWSGEAGDGGTCGALA